MRKGFPLVSRFKRLVTHLFTAFPLLVFLTIATSQAKLQVLTTTSDLADLVALVGGDLISVESIARGTQDPHAIEAKPSFMVKASRADLLVSVGLGLEVGWLPSIVRGARNPRINPGAPGYFELGRELIQVIEPLEVPVGEISRSDGDVHPEGNPHFWLDPLRTSKVLGPLANKLATLDPTHAAQFRARALAATTRLESQTKEWQKRISASGISKVVTYHKTLSYFFDRFQIKTVAILEPKPGIPPSAGHILQVIQLIQTHRVPLVLIENYFDPSISKKLNQQVPTLRISSVPVSVGGKTSIHSLEDLYEELVTTMEGPK